MTTPERIGTQVGTEVAKAVGEVTKEVLSNLLGPPSAELGHRIGNSIAYWRSDNLLKLYTKLQKKYESSGFPKQALDRLPFGFKALIVEEGSREDDDSIQKLWVNLLGSAIDKGYSEQLKSIAQDLRNLTPLTVKVLMAIKHQNGERETPSEIDPIDRRISFQLASIENADLERAVAVIQKLGLVTGIGFKLDGYDLGINADDFSGEVRQLAEQIRSALTSHIEQPSSGANYVYDRKKTKSSGSFIWFPMELSVYGHHFIETCVD